MDNFGVLLKKIQYSLPWTYPAEIRDLIPVGSTVLDVGCGDGYLMSWINCHNDYQVFGIDINKKDLKLAEKRMGLFLPKKPIYQKLIFGNLTKKLPINKKYDVVLCSQMVEHLEKERAIKLIRNLEKMAKKRIIIATINGFFQFDSREFETKHDEHLSGWSPEDFSKLGYRVQGHGVKLIYKPGALKDRLPKYLTPIFFIVSYFATPLLHFTHPLALLLITYKNIHD